ncbi:MAG: OmpA family protein [Cytophagales bacterium]
MSKKKYDEMVAKKVKAEADAALCNDTLTQSKKEIEALMADLNISKTDLALLKEDTAKKKRLIEKMNKLYGDEAEKHEKLKKDYKELLSASAAEAGKLNSHITKKEQELMALESKVNKLSDELKKREERVQELEEVLANKEKAVNDLRNKVSNALLAFKDKGDLSISVKNGKVYVSMADKLLFKSGSTKIDEKGIDALKKLANVLKEQPDINVMVEGHTDDVPVSKGTPNMIDNWDLSVLRATSIMRILIDEGVSPIKITPAGKGEFSPVMQGKTAEARQKNRRTEIILTPKLDELFKILENN